MVTRIIPVLTSAGLITCQPQYMQNVSWTANTGPHTDVEPALVVDGGDLDVDVRFTATVRNVFEPNGRLFFQATSSEGEMSLRYPTAGDQFFVLKVRGVDVLNDQSIVQTQNTELAWDIGDEVRARAWYRPSTGQSGLRISVNGVYAWDQTGSTTGGALAAPTGTVSISGDQFIARFKTDVPTTQQPEILVLGDSTVAAWGQLTSACHALYTSDERWRRAGVGMIAVAGDTTQLQKAKFDIGGAGHVFVSSVNLRAVIVELGINNILAGDSEATTTTALQGLVNDIRAQLPSVKIVIAEMTPCKTYLDTQNVAYYPLWLALNADIMGTGTTPITGVDARVNAHEIALNDGTGALKSTYNFDNLHENNAGRNVVAGAYRTALQGVGVLP